MTAEDKARELVLKFYPNVQWKLGQEDCVKRAKNCALIAVDEILKNNKILFEDVLNDQYWEEIKQEIEKL
jgi:hypothetical protein